MNDSKTFIGNRCMAMYVCSYRTIISCMNADVLQLYNYTVKNEG